MSEKYGFMIWMDGWSFGQWEFPEAAFIKSKFGKGTFGWLVGWLGIEKSFLNEYEREATTVM